MEDQESDSCEIRLRSFCVCEVKVRHVHPPGMCEPNCDGRILATTVHAAKPHNLRIDLHSSAGAGDRPQETTENTPLLKRVSEIVSAIPQLEDRRVSFHS